MVETCKTVSTQAFQLWMNLDMTELGWPHPQVNVSGYVEPFDTWADMRELIKEETFGTPVRSIAYFCSVLPDPPPGTDTSVGRTKFCASSRMLASDMLLLDSAIWITGTVEAL